MDTKETISSGLRSATTVAKATGKILTAQDLINTVHNLRQDGILQDISKSIARKHADAFDSMYYSMIQKFGYMPKLKHHTDYKYTEDGIKAKITYYIDKGEKNMCYEGQMPESPIERDLRAKIKDMQKNHLGAETERFIEMARDSGRNEHLSNYARQLEQELYDVRNKNAKLGEALYEKDARIEQLTRSIRSWESSYHEVSRRYENYKSKHAPKKAPAKKTK